MALTVNESVGRVQVNGTDFNGTWPNPTTGNDCVSLDTYSTAVIMDGAAVAAVVSTSAGGNPSVTPSSPPVYSMYQTYYSQSYRWQVKCPGGSIGIRI